MPVPVLGWPVLGTPFFPVGRDCSFGSRPLVQRIAPPLAAGLLRQLFEKGPFLQRVAPPLTAGLLRQLFQDGPFLQ